VAIYLIEAGLKLVFYGMDYFADGWNRYEFITATGLFLMTIICASVEHISPGATIVLLLFRIMKLVVLVRHFSVLKKMWEVFMLALPSVITITLLLLVVMYIFAVIGIFLFQGVKLQDTLNFNNNFQTSFNAFIAIYKMATCDAWLELMYDAGRDRTQYFDCVYYPTYSDVLANGGEVVGCGVPYSTIFCVIVIIVVVMVFLNTFIAVVVGSLLEISKDSESALSDASLAKFLEVWKVHDPKVKLLFKALGHRIHCLRQNVSYSK
jgi:voltage-gated sodium channel